MVSENNAHHMPNMLRFLFRCFLISNENPNFSSHPIVLRCTGYRLLSSRGLLAYSHWYVLLPEKSGPNGPPCWLGKTIGQVKQKSRA